MYIAYIHTSKYSHTHVYTSYKHTCTCARHELRTSEAAKMYVCACMYVHTCVHTCVHRLTYIYIYIYTCICVYITQTYLHVCPPRTTHKRGSSRQQHSTPKSRGQHLRENHCPCHIYISLYPHLYVLSMGWLRLVGSIKLQVSFAEYCLFNRALLQKRPIMLSMLLTKATP